MRAISPWSGRRLTACDIGRAPWLVLTLVLLLAACSTGPRLAPEMPVPPADWQGRRAALLAIDHWSVSGRVGVSSRRGAWSATLHWAQRKDAYDVSLFGPFGQGAMQLRGDRDGGVLRTSDNKAYAAQDMTRLLSERLGVPIPLRGLRYWARGLPVPDAARRFAFDRQGRLAWLEQLGWRVVYLRYMPVHGVQLPQRIDIQRDDVRVKLVIFQWHFEA